MGRTTATSAEWCIALTVRAFEMLSLVRFRLRDKQKPAHLVDDTLVRLF